MPVTLTLQGFTMLAMSRIDALIAVDDRPYLFELHAFTDLTTDVVVAIGEAPFLRRLEMQLNEDANNNFTRKQTMAGLVDLPWFPAAIGETFSEALANLHAILTAMSSDDFAKLHQALHICNNYVISWNNRWARLAQEGKDPAYDGPPPLPTFTRDERSWTPTLQEWLDQYARFNRVVD